MNFNPGVLIPIIIFMIPIVAILTKHQQTMAQLLHSRQQGANMDEVNMLRAELRQMGEMIRNLTIAVDDLKSDVRSSKNLAEQLKVAE